MSKHISDRIMELISTYRDYYRFDREESSFSASIALGASPTSNKDTVVSWWKENKGIDGLFGCEVLGKQKLLISYKRQELILLD